MRTLFVALAALLVLPSCRNTESALTPTTTVVEGMRNASVVGDVLIGGQPDQESLVYLAEHGYKSVVSVRGEKEIDWDEQGAVEASGMSFHRIEMSNPVTEITDDQVISFADIMSQLDGPVVLHCGSGNRAAGLWATWLIEYQDIDPEEALVAAEAAGMRESIRAVVEARIRQKAETQE